MGDPAGPPPSPPGLSILHVDLDAFYASVEQLEDPRLAGRPVVVGGLGPRGVVATASYEARRLGIGSALPMARARTLCPHAVFLAPRPELYRDVSRKVLDIFRSFTPLVEPLALDEAFLDVTSTRRRSGDPAALGGALRSAVRQATGLAATVGVAGTKLIAKLASEAAKPDGLLVIERGRELQFLHPLPAERLWGVGPATLARLEGIGVRTIGDLAGVPERTLVSVLGQVAGKRLADLAWNRDPRRVEPDRPVKSVSREETFPRDVFDPVALKRSVVSLAHGTGEALRALGTMGRTVVLKVRYQDFRTVTRSTTLPRPVNSSTTIAQVASSLLDALAPGEGVRLLGVGVSGLGLEEGHQQQTLGFGFDAENDGPVARASGERHLAAEVAADAVRRRFGDAAVIPGSRLEAPSETPGPSDDLLPDGSGDR